MPDKLKRITSGHQHHRDNIKPRHVKHDSGMGRLGTTDPYEVMALVRAAAESPDLEAAGLWTHFATADEPESEYFGVQLERFARLAETVTVVNEARPSKTAWLAPASAAASSTPSSAV